MESTSRENDWAAVLQRALAVVLPQDLHPHGKKLKKCGVLVLLATHPEHGLEVLLTKRSEDLPSHRGQIAFPGGGCEIEELVPGGVRQTAIREAQEEVGVSPDDFHVLGELPAFFTVTDHEITPVLGYSPLLPGQIRLRSNPAEISEIFWFPLKQLSAIHHTEWYERAGRRVQVHFFDTNNHQIWGITAGILKNLLERLVQVGAY